MRLSEFLNDSNYSEISSVVKQQLDFMFEDCDDHESLNRIIEEKSRLIYRCVGSNKVFDWNENPHFGPNIQIKYKDIPFIKSESGNDRNKTRAANKLLNQIEFDSINDFLVCRYCYFLEDFLYYYETIKNKKRYSKISSLDDDIDFPCVPQTKDICINKMLYSIHNMALTFAEISQTNQQAINAKNTRKKEKLFLNDIESGKLSVKNDIKYEEKMDLITDVSDISTPTANKYYLKHLKKTRSDSIYPK